MVDVSIQKARARSNISLAQLVERYVASEYRERALVERIAQLEAELRAAKAELAALKAPPQSAWEREKQDRRRGLVPAIP